MSFKLTEFINKLLSLPSPSGQEDEVLSLFEKEISICCQVETDPQNNKWGILNKDSDQPFILLCAHADEISYIVTGITGDGFLKIAPSGGIAPVTSLAREVYINHDGERVPGIIGWTRQLAFGMYADDTVPKWSNLLVDIGAESREEAESMVSQGDHVIFNNKPVNLAGRKWTARGCDNRVGLAIVMEAFRQVAEKGVNYRLGVAALVQEEIGLRGSLAVTRLIRPDQVLNVDATFDTQMPQADSSKYCPLSPGKGVAIAIGGISNRKLSKDLINIAKEKNIKYQLEVMPARHSTDSDSFQIGNSAVTCISFPVRYMHTPRELFDLDDVEAAIKLIVEYCLSLNNPM